ncbi:hypothetical protein ACVWXO_001780 [Bradyrhizobium sp. LM2.7]
MRRSNPECFCGKILDCFASLAMTVCAAASPHKIAFCREIAIFRAPEALNVCHRSRRKPERSACARRTIQRLAVRAGEGNCRAPQKIAQGRGAVRDWLRPLGPAAYRHLRRGRAHLDGAPRLPRADRGQDQDAPARLLRRHGRPAQGAGQRAEQGHAGAISRQAADRGAGPVLERTSLVRRRQQRTPARLPRSFRLRLRIRELD